MQLNNIITFNLLNIISYIVIQIAFSEI
jgi:hypothetical protein